jgi:CheY-like chemotaxis protein
MHKLKILIVENDEDEIEFMCESLNKSGLFEVVAIAETGAEVIRLLQDCSPDVILSDLNMPGKNGYDVLAELKADHRYSLIPVYISSTSSTPTTINRCLELGAEAYLLKPDTLTEYDNFVKRLYQKIAKEEK